MMPDADLEKRSAARAALDMVADCKVLGLGTGSTAAHFVRLLGQRVAQAKLRLRCVATSKATEDLALGLGLVIVSPNEVAGIDLAVDGADEVDADFALIKGGGGALLREKIVAAAATRFVIMVDSAKLVAQLGRFALPVEVTPFGWGLTAKAVRRALAAHGCPRQEVGLRQALGGGPFITDGGNYILDCQCAAIAAPHELAGALDGLAGVVEHGLFLDLVHTLIIGRGDQSEIRTR
jgi:ribose 5-phosphate isomerase A